MILIEDNINLFNDEEKKLLEEKCKNFIIDEYPNSVGNYKNFYTKYNIYNKDKNYESIFEKVKKYLKKNLKNDNFTLEGVWINKVDTETNKSDDFHTDDSDLTFLIYLNEDFDGGEFEYEDENKFKHKIKPKKYLGIITNNKVSHRVNPVVKGVRYSMVFFYYYFKKNTQTII